MPEAREPGAALDLRGVVKNYGDDCVVDHVSLEVKPGEFLTLLGPSGSGKTTTLNMIAGFVELTGGEILMDGAPLAAVRPHKRNIGMIFQNYALFPHMTAAENVAYPLKQRRVGKREVAQRVEEALNLVGLRGFDDRYPRHLSGGQQQRVAFARAVVFNPRVLLMDEPLGALDRKLRETLQIEIKRIHRELGITVIYVTHDQDEALALSDRIAVFNDGRIDQVGPPAELYERPQTLFVARFIGESNIFPGRATAKGAGTTLTCDGVVLNGPPSDPAPAGDAVLMVRPQKLSVVRGDSTALDNVLPGRIVDTVYLGQTLKLVVELEMGMRVTLRERAEQRDQVRLGDRIQIGWNAHDCVLLADVDPPTGANESGTANGRAAAAAGVVQQIVG